MTIRGSLRRPSRNWLFAAGLLLASSLSAADPIPTHLNGKYTATAYSVTGITASGQYTHQHVVAADPDILPIGSRIRIRRAGRYSGEYVVADTGQKITGRRLDIYMPNTVECVKFGRKPVRIKVIAVGDGTRAAAKQADQAVKKDVAQDIAKGTVGQAATEKDWVAKGGPTTAAAKATATGTRSADAATGPSAPKL